MKKENFDFYDRTSLKSYNLDRTMQDQLSALGSLDVFTRQHSENVAANTCIVKKGLQNTSQFVHTFTTLAKFLFLQKFYKNQENLQRKNMKL